MLAAGLALALLALVFGPGLSGWASGVVGTDDVDTWGTQWFYWFIGRRLGAGEPFAHTDLLFYPWGKDVYLHTGGNVLDAVAALPLRYLLGPFIGYNLFAVLVLCANGLAAAWACRSLGVGGRAASMAGALFVVCPAPLFELAGGRPTQALLAPLLLFFAGWWRLGGRIGWWGVLATGIALALTGLSYWFYALFAVVVGAPGAVFSLVRPDAGVRRPIVFLRHLLVGVVALACALPLALPMLQAASAGTVPGLLDTAGWSLESWTPVTVEGWRIGLMGFDPATLSSGFSVQAATGFRFVDPQPTVLWTQLVLAAAGLWVARRRWRWTLAAGILCAVLIATGPTLVPPDGPGNPVYLALVELSPMLRRMWWPGRLISIAQVGLLGLMALALARLDGRRALQRALLVVIALAWGGELWVRGASPLPVAPAPVPAAYHCLSAAPEGAVFELPFGGVPARLHYQAVHGKPLFGGMVEDNPVFSPAEHAAVRQTNAWVAAAIAMADGRDQRQAPAVHALAQGAGELAAWGYRYVVLDKRALAERRGVSAGGDLVAARRARLMQLRLREFLGPATFEDADSAIFMPWGGELECPDPGGPRPSPR